MARRRGSVLVTRQGRYLAYVSVPKPTGRRSRESLGTFDTRGEAEDAIATWYAEGRHLEPSQDQPVASVQLAELLPLWLLERHDWVEIDELKLSTWRCYELVVRERIVPYLGDLTVEELTPEVLKEWHRDLRKRPVSSRTVALSHTVLSMAIREQLPGIANPLEVTKPFKKGKSPRSKKPLRWSHGELTAFLDHVRQCDDPGGRELYPLWRLLAMTGMRRGEAAGLEWSDIDFTNGTVSVRRSMIMVGGQRRIETPKTAAGERVIGIDNVTMEALRAHEEETRELRRIGGRTEHGDLVFRQANGAAPDPNRWTRWFGQHARHAGVPVLKLHSLRHTHASVLLERNAALLDVSGRLGHASPVITASIYSHSLAIDRIDRMRTAVADIGI